MTIEEVLVRKRWMRLALPDDVQQCIALAKLMAPTPHRQAVALDYLLRELRYEAWDKFPSKKAWRPQLLKPSALARCTGYMTDSERKRQAREKVSPERRKEIAQLAAAASRNRTE